MPRQIVKHLSLNFVIAYISESIRNINHRVIFKLMLKMYKCIHIDTNIFSMQNQYYYLCTQSEIHVI